MELSAKVEYALLALMEMASRYAQKEPLKLNEITTRQAIPDRYLEQILTNLRYSGIIQSQRGAKGGYVLTKEPWQITLLEIVVAVGDIAPERSRQRNGKDAVVDEIPTVEKSLVYEIWQQAKEASQTVLRNYTLQDLCHRRDLYKQINPMYYI